MKLFAFTTLYVVVGWFIARALAFDDAHSIMLAKRQTAIISPDQVPSQCQSQCSSLNNCSDAACLCTDTINQGMVTCMNCVLSSDGSSPDPQTADAIQFALIQYEDACKSLGKAVSSLTISGVDSSVTALPSGVTQTLEASPSITSPPSPNSTSTSSGSGSTGNGQSSTNTSAGVASSANLSAAFLALIGLFFRLC